MRTSMIAVAAALALAGTGARAEQTVRVGTQRFVHFGPVSYLTEVGSKHGLRVEQRIFDKGIDMIPRLLSGDLDVAAMATDVAVAARATGAPIVLVGAFAKGGTRIVGRSDLDLKKIPDLKGKKVGVARGSVVELLLLAELAKHNLTWSEHGDRDVTLVYVPHGELNGALQSHRIDAMCQSEPYSTEAIHQGFGKELMKPYDTPLGEPARVVVVSEKLYREKPEVAQHVVDALVESVGTFQRSPAVAEKFVREKLFEGRLTAQSYADAVANASFSTDISVQTVKVTTDLMMKYGVGKMLKAPDAAEWVRLELLQKAKHSR